jgi:hypothetical protein
VSLIGGLVGAALVGILDYLAGNGFEISVLYLAPIFYGTWKATWRTGFILAMVAGLIALLADVLAARPAVQGVFPYWNALNRLSLFFLTSMAAERIRKSHSAQNVLGMELSSAMAEARGLSRLLPICPWCRKIRSETGSWLPIETYLSDHSEAPNTPVPCPECHSRMHEIASPGQPMA